MKFNIVAPYQIYICFNFNYNFIRATTQDKEKSITNR